MSVLAHSYALVGPTFVNCPYLRYDVLFGAKDSLHDSTKVVKLQSVFTLDSGRDMVKWKDRFELPPEPEPMTTFFDDVT